MSRTTPNLIPLSRPDLTAADREAVAEVLKSGVLSEGPQVEAFEDLCAKLAGRSFAVAVNSGTSALLLSLIAAGVGPGDEVIASPLAGLPAANAILACGATPIFADVEVRSLNLDPALVEAKRTPRTKAILASATFGHPATLDTLEAVARRNEAVLITDASGAVGSKLGDRPTASFGRAGVHGFGPGRTIQIGEGGVIVTDDDRLADYCRTVRSEGRTGTPPRHERAGFNLRLTELSAALGVSQLARLEETTAAREEIVTAYIGRLLDSKYVTLPTVGEGETAAWSSFVVRLNTLFEPGDRDAACRLMGLRGIECGRDTAAIHREPLLGKTSAASCPVAERAGERALQLPLYVGLSAAEVERICAALDATLEEVLLKQKRFN